MSLAVAPANPLPYLKKESDTIKQVMDELEQTIEKSINQLQALRAVYDAINNELDRLRSKETQLELLLEDEG